MGLGLSSDSSMGQELAVLCSSSSRAQLYWNEGKAAPRLLGPLGGARVEEEDGRLVCEVDLPEVGPPSLLGWHPDTLAQQATPDTPRSP